MGSKISTLKQSSEQQQQTDAKSSALATAITTATKAPPPAAPKPTLPDVFTSESITPTDFQTHWDILFDKVSFNLINVKTKKTEKYAMLSSYSDSYNTIEFVRYSVIKNLESFTWDKDEKYWVNTRDKNNFIRIQVNLIIPVILSSTQGLKYYKDVEIWTVDEISAYGDSYKFFKKVDMTEEQFETNKKNIIYPGCRIQLLEFSGFVSPPYFKNTTYDSKSGMLLINLDHSQKKSTTVDEIEKVIKGFKFMILSMSSYLIDPELRKALDFTYHQAQPLENAVLATPHKAPLNNKLLPMPNYVYQKFERVACFKGLRSVAFADLSKINYKLYIIVVEGDKEYYSFLQFSSNNKGNMKQEDGSYRLKFTYKLSNSRTVAIEIKAFDIDMFPQKRKEKQKIVSGYNGCIPTVGKYACFDITESEYFGKIYRISEKAVTKKGGSVVRRNKTIRLRKTKTKKQI